MSIEQATTVSPVAVYIPPYFKCGDETYHSYFSALMHFISLQESIRNEHPAIHIAATAAIAHLPEGIKYPPLLVPTVADSTRHWPALTKLANADSLDNVRIAVCQIKTPTNWQYQTALLENASKHTVAPNTLLKHTAYAVLTAQIANQFWAVDNSTDLQSYVINHCSNPRNEVKIFKNPEGKLSKLPSVSEVIFVETDEGQTLPHISAKKVVPGALREMQATGVKLSPAICKLLDGAGAKPAAKNQRTRKKPSETPIVVTPSAVVPSVQTQVEASA